MEDLVAWIILSLGGIAFVIIGVWAKREGRRRTKAVANWAKANGFTVLGRASNIKSHVHAFKLFSKHQWPDFFRNIIEGVKEGDVVTVFDYCTLRVKRWDCQTVCVVRSQNLRLPHFFARSQIEGYDWLGKLFGGQDINFDEDANFSKAIVLQGEDEDAARRIFCSDARALVTKLASRNVVIEGSGNTLVLYFERELVELDHFAELVIHTLRLRHALG